MNVGGIVLGLINVAIVVVVLLLIGVAVWFVVTKWVTELPQEVRKLYIALVALVALYMIVALLLGLPSVRVIGSSDPAPQYSRIEPTRGQIYNPPSIARP